MPTSNQSRPEIPVSKENNLYFVDQSLVEFAKSYKPAKQGSQGEGQSANTAGIFCSPTPSIGRSDKNR